jgi:hypothetical protein
MVHGCLYIARKKDVVNYLQQIVNCTHTQAPFSLSLQAIVSYPSQPQHG